MLERVSRKGSGFGLDRLIRATTLIYGLPKVGKTTFAASFPDVLLIELEPGGADYVTDCDVIEINSLEELRALYAELKAQPQLKWQVLAIDTVDMLSSWFERQIAIEYGKTILAGPSSAFGAEYARHRAEVMAVLKAFQVLPTGLILIAHARQDERRTTLNLPGRYLAMDIMAMASNVIYVGIADDGRREAIVSPSPALEAGSRDPILNAIGRFPPSFQELAKRYLEEAQRLGYEVKSEAAGSMEASQPELIPTPDASLARKPGGKLEVKAVLKGGEA